MKGGTFEQKLERPKLLGHVKSQEKKHSAEETASAKTVKMETLPVIQGKEDSQVEGEVWKNMKFI